MYNKKIQVSWHPLKKNYLPSNVEFAFSSPNNKAEEVGAYMYTLNSPPQSASLVSPSYNAAGCDCRFETAAFCAPLVLSRLNDCHSLRRIYARKVCVCVCVCVSVGYELRAGARSVWYRVSFKKSEYKRDWTCKWLAETCLLIKNSSVMSDWLVRTANPLLI